MKKQNKKKERGKLLKLRDRLFTSSRWHEECLNISYSEIYKDVPSSSDRFKIQGGKKGVIMQWDMGSYYK